MKKFTYLILIGGTLSAQSPDFSSYKGKQIYDKNSISAVNSAMQAGTSPAEATKSLDAIGVLRVKSVEKSGESFSCEVVLSREGQEAPFGTVPCDSLVLKDSLKLAAVFQAEISFKGKSKNVAVEFNIQNVVCEQTSNAPADSCTFEVSISQSRSPVLGVESEKDSFNLIISDPKGKRMGEMTLRPVQVTAAIPKDVPMALPFSIQNRLRVEPLFAVMKAIIATAQNEKEANAAIKSMKKMYKARLELNSSKIAVDMPMNVILTKTQAFISE